MMQQLPFTRVLVEPVFTCSLCGKAERQNGFVNSVPAYWACQECRAKMPRIVLRVIVYKDGWRDLSGHCDFCNTFPCKHVTQTGELRNLPKWDANRK
jgi:hypothetical protein